MAPRLAIGGGAASRWMPSVCNALPLSMAGREEAAAEAAAHGPTPTPTPTQPNPNPNPNPNLNPNPNPNPTPNPNPNPEWRQRPPHKTPKALAERHSQLLPTGRKPRGWGVGRGGGLPPQQIAEGSEGVRRVWTVLSSHYTIQLSQHALCVQLFMCAYVSWLLGWF